MTTLKKPKGIGKDYKELPDEQLEFDTSWVELFEDNRFLAKFNEEIIREYIISQRWYAGKASTIKYIQITNIQPYTIGEKRVHGLVLEVNFREAFVQTYFLPLVFLEGSPDLPEKAKVCQILLGKEQGVIVDAIYLDEFRAQVFKNIQESQQITTETGTLTFERGSFLSMDEPYESSRLLTGEQSNTSIIINDKYILKIYRRLYDRANPDYEMSFYLTERKAFPNSPKYAGSVNWVRGNNYSVSVALMQELIPNQGDAWEFFLPPTKAFFLKAIQQNRSVEFLPSIQLFSAVAINRVPHELYELFGENSINRVKLLGQRTAEMHVKLGQEIQDLDFTPSNYNSDYTVWLKNRLIYQYENRVNLLENTLFRLSERSKTLASEFLEYRKQIRDQILSFDETKLRSQRIRVHGDYHLGQVLVTDDDFYIIDFEGEPESTIRDRKVKQSPLKDVAGLFRSFHYSIYATIFNNEEELNADLDYLFELGEWLYSFMVGIFLDTYVNIVQENNLNIGYQSEIEYLLRYNILEKAVYELGYELNARPTWTIIPLKGISQILKSLKSQNG
ncbi:MAG: phosphotransferase [Saprospiraceae bacterium]|nr:phosphotransferase [Saprospiraceae bacterium]